MKTHTIEPAIHALFIGNTYNKNTTDNDFGYPAIVRDVLIYFRTLYGNAIGESQMEIKMKTDTVIGGEQETLSVTVSFQGGGTLAVLLFFVSTKENKTAIRINDVWVTVHTQSLEEEISRKKREKVQKLAQEAERVAAGPVEVMAEEPETPDEAEAG